jgi:hypothetical protein
MVEHGAWRNSFDRLISYWRHLRRPFGLPVRAEMKANFLLRNGGPFRKLALSESARFAIYRQTMRLHPKPRTSDLCRRPFGSKYPEATEGLRARHSDLP